MRQADLWLVLCTAVVIRAAVAWAGLQSLNEDPDSYARLAVQWKQTGTFGFGPTGNSGQEGEAPVVPTAFRPPLYPWLLSWLVNGDSLAIKQVAVLHVLLGVASVALTWSIGRRLGLSYPAVPALVVAVDPILLRQSQLVMTETLVTFLAALAWWLWLLVWPPRVEATNAACHVRRTSPQWISLASLGWVFGLSILARPTAAPWVALCLLAMPWFGCTCWKRRINDCVLVACIAGSCVVPWTLRNYSVLGKPIWATTHGGYTLLLANNPSIYAHFQDQGGSRGWDPFAFHADWARHELLGELEQDSLAYELAGDTIRHNPRMFLLSSLYRLGWLWALWPHVESLVVKVVIGLWYGTLMLSALLGLGIALFGLRRRGNGEGWGAWVVPLALVISLTTIHSIFWSNMRMRAPATVALAVAAGIVGNRRQFSHCEIAELQVNSCKYS